jgi:UDPglucose--hexose-1-phosphate uridylyltransferase
MYRRDPITGARRLVAPGRASRLVDQPAGCPFCPGNEAATPAETGRRDSRDGDQPWGARSFPNRFPLTDPHELVVPTPRHVTSWRELTLPELQDGLGLLLERRAALLREDRYVHVFANDGAAAGASVSHVHAQLVSLDRTDATDALVHGVRDPQACALCALLAGSPELLVQRGNHHALLAHPVPRLGGGLLLVPLEHRSEPDPGRLAELAELLHRAWLAIDPALDANCWFVADERRAAHWYVELQPRTAGLAGVELALGLSISTAEAAATAERARERLAMRGS